MMETDKIFSHIVVGAVFLVIGIILHAVFVCQPQQEWEDFNYAFVDVLRADNNTLAANQNFFSIQLSKSIYFGKCWEEDRGIMEIDLNDGTYTKEHVWVMYCPLREEER